MNRKWLRWVAGALISLLCVTAGFAAGTVELVSQVDPSQISDTGAGADPSYNFDPPPRPPSLSADGRYAVFLSPMTNLVSGQREGNGAPEKSGEDVFLADLVAGTVTLVSHAMSSPSTTGNQASQEAVLSADGRWVAFASAATDLVPGQAGNPSYFDNDVLLFDRVSGATTLVAATREDLSGFENLAISADGRYAVFDSEASDLVPGQQGDSIHNAFLYDRVEKTTRLVSHVSGSPTTAGGGSQRGISADGRFILLSGDADLAPGLPAGIKLLLYDRVTDTFAPVGFEEQTAALSADGRYVVYPGLTSLFFYARETGVTSQVEVGPTTLDYSDQPLSLSADGRFAAFLLKDPPGGYGDRLAVCDRVSGTLVTEARPVPQYGPSIDAFSLSADGRFAVFATSAANAVAGEVDANGGQDDVFLFDRTTGKTTLVSGAAGSPLTTANGASIAPAISGDGTRVIFASLATDLVDGLKDLNEGLDLVAYDVAGKSLQWVTRRAADLPSLSPATGGESGDLSADGRFAAFVSTSGHVVPGQVDTNGKEDVFLYDRTARTVLLVSRTRASATTAASGRSLHPAVSADGRYVAFTSDARNLVPGANPTGVRSLFLFDRVTGAVSFVARTEAEPTFHLSPDGRWLAFTSAATDLVPGQQDQPVEFGVAPTPDVFLWDRTTGALTLVSHSAAGPAVTGNDSSFTPVLSADGRYVAFDSEATDLIAGQTGEHPNVFLWDRVTRTTTLVSHARGSALTGAGLPYRHSEEPAITPDGRFLVFGSQAGDLDLTRPPSLSASNLYLYDRSLGTVQWISDSGSEDAQPRISADGRFVAFVSTSQLGPVPFTFYPQIFLYDRTARAFTLVTRPNVPNDRGSDGYAQDPAISSDGRYIAFTTTADDLVAGVIPASDPFQHDLYLYDRTAGTLTLISHPGTSPLTAVGWITKPVISASGRQIAFTSAVDFAPGDLDRLPDAYLFSLDPPPTVGPVTVPPCALFDLAGLRSNVRRPIKVAGRCGVPATATRVLLKVTALQATGMGNLRLYPGDVTTAAAGTLRFDRGQTASASFDLPLATNGNGTLAILPFVRGNGTVRVMVEVDGYVP